MAQVLTLNVGLDSTLLETRGRVLQTGGYTVVSSLSVTDAAKKFLAGDFDLVILCHSISRSDRRRLADCVHEHSPLTPVVLVSATGIDQDTSVDATIGNDPEQLLQDLQRIFHAGRGHVRARQESA